jgi:addiction module HigA family antidote
VFPFIRARFSWTRHLGISQVRINEIVNGKRGVSAETAWLLAETFGTSPQFWINLQANYDLATNKPTRRVRRIKRAS